MNGGSAISRAWVFSRSALRTLGFLGLLSTAAQSGAAQTIRGRVTDGQSARPLQGVTVELTDEHEVAAAHTETAADGRYQLHVPQPARYRALFRLPGFQSMLTEPVKLTERDTLEISPQLTPLAAFKLDSVFVYGQRVPRYLGDFYRRRSEGFGHFLTRADIDRHSPVVISDVLRGLAGVQVVCHRAGLCDVQMRAARTMFVRGVCRASVVLDGVVLRVGGVGSPGDLLLDDLLNPFDVEAIEVYPSPAGVPVQYQGYASPCGAIIAWSRR